jgi:hypothetical protein
MKSKLPLFSLLGLIALVSIAATAVSTKISETTDSVVVARTGDKLAFFGGTAVVRPASANQAVVTLTAVTNSTAAATDLTTTEALANALKTQGNATVVDVAALKVEIDALRTALVNLGLIKGS